MIHSHVCVCMHTQLFTNADNIQCKYLCCLLPSLPHPPTHCYNSKHHTASCCTHTHTCSPTAHHHQHSVHLHSVHLYKLLSVSCIDHVPPNPQDGRTPLMLAAVKGRLPVARLLVETYHCDVNEEDGKVSGWEVMGGVRECSTCVSSTCDQ